MLKKDYVAAATAGKEGPAADAFRAALVKELQELVKAQIAPHQYPKPV